MTAPDLDLHGPGHHDHTRHDGQHQGRQDLQPEAPDSATNDIPPAKGSPQAQFEQQCKQNPVRLRLIAEP